MIIGAAAIGFLGLYALQRSAITPTTDDASIDADVIHIAGEVGGRIVNIPVEENSPVKKRLICSFRIDPVPYQLVVDQARARPGGGQGRSRNAAPLPFDPTIDCGRGGRSDAERGDEPRTRHPHGRAASSARRQGLRAEPAVRRRRRRRNATQRPRSNRRASDRTRPFGRSTRTMLRLQRCGPGRRNWRSPSAIFTTPPSVRPMRDGWSASPS